MKTLFKRSISIRSSHDCSRQIHYRLCHIGGTSSNDYQIYVQYLKDHACASFQAKTPQSAKQIYRMIVNGNVTPCTLMDVVEDLTGT